jgi:DNA-binding NtrC family response regulator
MSVLPKVLCVDDEPFILNSIERIFSEKYEIYKAISAADALKLIDLHDFDVIISDQRMPGMTGTELLTKIKNKAPRAIRLLLTGYADLEAVRSAVNDGEVFRYITKPWNNNDLRSVVDASVQAAKSGDASSLIADSNATVATFSPILVIDDDPEVFQTCQQVVGKNGQVFLATSIEEGLASLRKIQKLGIVIAAHKIGQDNTELLIKSIKSFHPTMVTILMSESHDATSIVRLINEGQIFRCIFKPTKRETLQRVLLNAQLRHRALEDSTDLLARFQVPVPIELQTAQSDASIPHIDLKRSWTQRFSSLFFRPR